MTASDFSVLNETFFSQDYPEVNENLCFNTELLEQCRLKAPRIEKYLKSKRGYVYGTLVEPQLQLIPIDSIHGLDPITNNKTGKKKPRGFQIRADEDLDSNVVDDLVYSITEKDWDPSANQPVFFRLGEEWEYTDNNGFKKIFGIANSNHRYTAANKTHQTHIVGWVIDMPVQNIKKWAAAEANRQALSSKPRTDNDIIQSIMTDLNEPTSELAKTIERSPNTEYTSILMEEALDYNISSKKVASIVRAVIHTSGLKPERKEWAKDQAVAYITEHKVNWIKIKHDIYDYTNKEETYFAIVVQDEGRGVQMVVDKYIQHLLSPNRDKKLIVIFSTAKTANITKENRAQIRRSFMTKVHDKLVDYNRATNLIFNDMDATMMQYIALPEFDDEESFVFVS